MRFHNCLVQNQSWDDFKTHIPSPADNLQVNDKKSILVGRVSGKLDLEQFNSVLAQATTNSTPAKYSTRLLIGKTTKCFSTPPKFTDTAWQPHTVYWTMRLVLFWAHISGNISMDTCQWKHIVGRISVKTYRLKNISENISLEKYQWKHIVGKISVKTYR